MMILIIVMIRMTGRPIVKMMILIRQRILGIKSIFTMWIITMKKFKKMASTSITFWWPRLSLSIVEAGQELLVLRVT